MVLTSSMKDSSVRQPSTKVSSRSFNHLKAQNAHSDRAKKKHLASHDQQNVSTEVDGVITGEEIQKLAIKDEDLFQLRKSLEVPGEAKQETKPPHTNKLLVKKQKPPPVKAKRSKKVVVARNAPPDAELKPIDYSGPSGPRYNHETGEIMSHTLLGSVEDFITEAIKHNYIEPESRSAAITPVEKELPIKRAKPEIRPRDPLIRLALNQENALLNWQQKMAERKRQQGYISKLLQKPVDRLVMHKDDEYRRIQEKRKLVDRSIPAVDYGKGYRVGSEFWKQHENFGDDIKGIKMTLTKTERGVPTEFEHVAKPSALRHETGLLNSGSDEITQNPARTWERSEYLKQRCRQLEPVMLELDPLQPKMKNLQVIGQGCEKESDNERTLEEPLGQIQKQMPEKYDDRETEYADPLEKYPDVFPQQLRGPSIVFGEHLAAWNGSCEDNIGKIGHVARVFFETAAKERITSHLKIHNNGTTAIYYHWRKVATPPAFESIKRDSVQRFYFNNGEGVVLPGETKQFPFIFKSPNPGIFTETWQFLTEPVVLGGASLRVSLKGVAVEDDTNYEARNQILKEIMSKEAEVAARSIIDEIISSIRESDRPPSPVDAYVTEQELFKRLNPSCQYNYETILELKNFYLQLFPEETRAEHNWSLSLSELKDCITAIPDETAKEELLSGLDTVVSGLGSKSFSPAKNAMYSACYHILQKTLDGLCSTSMRIRSIMGLPEVVMEPMSDVEASVYSVRSAYSGSSAGNSRRSKSLSVDDKKGKGGKKPPAKEDPKAKGKGKKDAKEKERPKSKEPKGGKGKGASAGTTPTKDAPSERDLAVRTPSSTKAPPVDSLDPATRKKYTEKMYSQVYSMLCDAIDEMSEMFTDIKQAHEIDE